MPPIRRTSTTEPVAIAPSQGTHAASPPFQTTVPAGVSELMISSLPPMASGADVYLRQFYRGSELPWRRYLPLSGL